MNLGIVMDPIGSIKTAKDSSFAMLLEGMRRKHRLWYMEISDLCARDGVALGNMRELEVYDNKNNWFSLSPSVTKPLHELDVVLMRKDPPFDMEYVYSTYLLELAEQRGTLIVNRPSALRDANEKLSTAWFPQCCAPCLVSRQMEDFRAFLSEQGDIILKPLDGMGGASIFRIKQGDPNTSVILETLTQHGNKFAMAQRFIPEISQGDKRILVVDGEPVPWALARLPAPGETRGNLAAGGIGKGAPLSDRDFWIVNQVAPQLKARGILFAGLDVIGDYLTEINITSPTCIRELDKIYGLNIAAMLMDAIEKRLEKKDQCA